MRALVWHGDQDIVFEDLPEPVAKEGEVVFEVKIAGICGSDLHGYRGHPGPRVPPLVLGHEVVGRVGGESFAVYPLEGCGTCEHCRGGEDNLCDSWRLLGMHRSGAFAERVAISTRSLVGLPEGIDERRAVLTEPVACCVAALRPHSVIAGTRVLIIGCGPIGLLTIFLAAGQGAEVYAVDPIPARRALAERLGAAATDESVDQLDPAARSVELAIDAAGFETTWRECINAVQPGGAVVVIGLGQAEGAFPMATLVRRAVTMRGQFAYSRADFSRAIELLAQGDLELDWITERPLSDGAQAFSDLIDRPAQYSKILLRP